MKSEAQTPSSSRPSVGATAVPVAETPIAEAPVAEAAVAETSIMEETLAEAPVAPSFPPAPMETGGAGDGQSWAEQVEAVEEEPFKGAGRLNAPALNPGGMSRHPGFPSPSRMVRGGSPPSHSCMSMQLHNQPPHTM